MVLDKSKTIYRCPYCHDKYDTEDEAFDCAQDCVDIDTPEEDYEEMYVCEVCGKDYDDENDASDCENKHKKSDDLEYGSYLWKIKQKELEKARNHPEQTRLII